MPVEPIELPEIERDTFTKSLGDITSTFEKNPPTIEALQKQLTENTHLPEKVIKTLEIENGKVTVEVERDGKTTRIELSEYTFDDLSEKDKKIEVEKNERLKKQNKVVPDSRTIQRVESESKNKLAELEKQGKEGVTDPAKKPKWYDKFYDKEGNIKQGVIDGTIAFLKGVGGAGVKIGLLFLVKYLVESDLNAMADAATGCYLENDRTHDLIDNMGKSIGEENCTCGSSVVRSRCSNYCTDLYNFDGPPHNSYVADWCGGNCCDQTTGDPNKCINCDDDGKGHTTCGCYTHDSKTNTDTVLSPGVSFKWQKVSGLEMFANVLAQTGLVIKGVVETTEGAVLDVTEGVKSGLSNLYKGLIMGAIVIGVVAIIGISIYVSKKYKKPPPGSGSGSTIMLSTPVATVMPPATSQASVAPSL